MKELIIFQIKRYKNKNILLLMPLLLLAIGFLGLLLGIMFYGKDAAPAMWLVSVYNSYTQFTFMFLIYIFISSFTDDFVNGIYAFMKQIGHPLKKCIFSKSIVIFFMTFFGSVIFILITHVASGNTDISYFFTILLSVIISLIFIILFALILSLLIKKTITATLIAYGAFLVMDILNFVGFGLTNPADGNSISSVSIRCLAGHPVEHYSLQKVDIDYAQYGYLLATLPGIIWDIILLIIVLFLITREGKRNEV